MLGGDLIELGNNYNFVLDSSFYLRYQSRIWDAIVSYGLACCAANVGYSDSIYVQLARGVE